MRIVGFSGNTAHALAAGSGGDTLWTNDGARKTDRAASYFAAVSRSVSQPVSQPVSESASQSVRLRGNRRRRYRRILQADPLFFYWRAHACVGADLASYPVPRLVNATVVLPRHGVHCRFHGSHRALGSCPFARSRLHNQSQRARRHTSTCAKYMCRIQRKHNRTVLVLRRTAFCSLP